jgi:hypothetical protein
MQRKTWRIEVIATTIIGLLGVIAGSGPAAAQASSAGIYGPGGISPLTVALGCHVENEKVLAISNSGAGAIPAGTAISYDMIRKPDHARITRVVHIGAPLTPGGVVRVGVVPSFSCTAWFRRTLVTAPSRG